MPPFVGRKRRSSSPLPGPQPVAKKAKKAPPKNAKSPPVLRKKTSRFSVEGSSDSSSSSDVDSDQFENVPHAGQSSKSKTTPFNKHAAQDEEDEDMEWEDAPNPVAAPERKIRDIRINVNNNDVAEYNLAPQKKGASKRDKQKR